MDSFAQPRSTRTPTLARPLPVCRPGCALRRPFTDLERQQDAATDDPCDGARQSGKSGEPRRAGNGRRVCLERSKSECSGSCRKGAGKVSGSADRDRTHVFSVAREMRSYTSPERSDASLRKAGGLGVVACRSAGTPALAQCDRCRRASRALARSEGRKLWALRNAWSGSVAEFRCDRAFGRKIRRKHGTRGAQKGQVALEVVLFLAVAMVITAFFLNSHFKLSRRWEVEVRKPWFTNR